MNKKKAYTGLRYDVVALIIGHPLKVLEVGCSSGILLFILKSILEQLILLVSNVILS